MYDYFIYNYFILIFNIDIVCKEYHINIFDVNHSHQIYTTKNIISIRLYFLTMV